MQMQYQWQANYSAMSLVLPALLVAMIFAVTAPAPKRRMQAHALVAILAAMLIMSAASIAAFTGILSQDVVLVMIAVGVFLGISSVWFARGRSGWDDDGGGGDDRDNPDRTPPQPDGLDLDWDDFDDHRSDWEEEHRPVVHH